MPPRRRKQQVELLKEEPVETQQEESLTNEAEVVNKIVEDLQSDQGSESESEQGSEQGSETESSNEQEQGIPFNMFPEMIRQQMESMQESSSNEDLANILSVFFHNSEGENVVDSLNSIRKSIDQNSKCVLKLTKVLEDNFSKASTFANMFAK